MHETDLLRAVLEYTDNAILIGSALRNGRNEITDFRLQPINKRAEVVLTGLLTEATGNVAVGTLINNKLLPSLWESMLAVVETGTSRSVESQLTADPGKSPWFLVTLHRHDDGIFMSLQDITASKQTEQGLQKTIDELQRSNQNLEQFAYVASHDLQEPLRKLVGFGEMLQNQYGPALGEQGIRLVQRMQSATQRMHMLIKDLLGFSRVTSVREPFSRIDLQEIVDGVLSDLESIIHEKKAVLDITSLPYLEGDAGQLGQLFQNLLSNALKFTRPGDIPLVRVDCEVILGNAIQAMPGTTVLATDLDRSFFAITVSDNGVGFDEKYLDRIFTIFQRLHNRTEYPGTGIGLAIVQKVVENHKGYLNARSQPGRGAEFTVYLPDEPALPELIRNL